MSLQAFYMERMNLASDSRFINANFAMSTCYKIVSLDNSGCTISFEEHLEEIEVDDAEAWANALGTTFKVDRVPLGYAVVTDHDGFTDRVIFNDCTLRLRCETQVCPTCHGRGRHVNPNIDAGGISSDDECWDDDDFRDQYFNGGFDVTCSGCKGQNVIHAPVFDDMPVFIKEYIDDYDRDEAYYQAERLAEFRMGC
jgi:hypothetical protein